VVCSEILLLLPFAADKAMRDGDNPVVIDNTNIQAWEMRTYVLLVRWIYMSNV